MRAIRFVLIMLGSFVVFGLLPMNRVMASDETWGIFQFRKRIDGGKQIFAEYVRRDRGALFQNPNIDLFRVSYGAKFEDQSWGYLFGIAYVDFETGSIEKRSHQFVVYNRTFENLASVAGRFGFEQRQFNDDESIYWRVRSRLQLNFAPHWIVGPSMYDEVFYVLDGKSRFASGFNENRFGVGLRYHSENLELMVFHTAAQLKSIRRDDRVEWLQLQTVFSF